MRSLLVPPPPHLRPWLQAGIAADFSDGGGTDLACRFPALVGSQLTVTLDGTLHRAVGTTVMALPRSTFSGPTTMPTTAWRSARLRCVGLVIQPAATATFLRGGAGLLADSTAAAADLWGPRWTAREEQVLAAPTPRAALELLFAFAWELVRDPLHAQRQATQQQLAAAVASAVDEAPHRLGVSSRQLERRCAAALGMRPKLFQRVHRVELALRAAMAQGSADADLALRLGWYDQSHMARDFRLLVGMAPGQLLASLAQDGSAYWPLQVGRGGMSHLS
jgi:AraC-like DNA-binding protein